MSRRRKRGGAWPGLWCVARAVRLLDGSEVEIRSRRELIPVAPAAQPGEGALIDALARLLYDRFHCRARAAQPGPALGGGEEVGLVAALSRANAGSGTWEPGWTLVSSPDEGHLVVSLGGVRFRAIPDQVRPDGVETQAVRVRLGPERREASPGFYLAVGDAPERWSADGPARTVRCYWHLRFGADGVALVAHLTTALNRGGVPFRLKVLRHPAFYPRADAGVLYVARCDWHLALPAVRAAHRALGPRLGMAVPLLALPLARGLSLAEDPGTAQSFGQHRSRLLAEGLWEARRRAVRGAASRLAAMEDALRAAGLDPARPYLSPASTADGFPPWATAPARARRQRWRVAATNRRIGRGLDRRVDGGRSRRP